MQSKLKQEKDKEKASNEEKLIEDAREEEKDEQKVDAAAESKPFDPFAQYDAYPVWRERPEVINNIPHRDRLPRQMTVLNENQRDWVHLVSEYYPEGNLSDMIMDKVNFKEHEMVNIIRGVLSAITYCHMSLNLVIANLNPEGIACEFKTKEYHTRVVNFSHSFQGPYKYVRQRLHQLTLDRISTAAD